MSLAWKQEIRYETYLLCSHLPLLCVREKGSLKGGVPQGFVRKSLLYNCILSLPVQSEDKLLELFLPFIIGDIIE